MSATSDRAGQRNLEHLGDNAAHVQRNHRLGVAAGVFAGLANNFLHPELIFVGLIYALTGSPVLAALVPLINKAGSLTPQLLASIALEHKSRRRPYFVALTFLRTGSFVALAATIFLLTIEVTPLYLTLFFLVYLVCCASGGAGHVIFMDMIGRLIDPHRIGSFIGMRQFLGGGLGVAVGLLVIQPILSRMDVPANYALLATIGAVLIGIDMSIWCQCREEPGPSANERTTLGESLRRGFVWMRDHHNYRCYFWSRIAFRFSYLGLVFFIPYGTERLEYAPGRGGMALLGGVMIATLKISGVLGSVLWGRVVDRYGSRRTMIWGSGLMSLSPLGALAAPHLPTLFEMPFPGLPDPFTLPLVVYLGALALFVFGIRGQGLGGQRYLINSAPPERRASYVAFLNTITSPLTLLPLAGGYFAHVAGMDAVFVVVALGGALAVGAAWAMHPEGPPVTRACCQTDGDEG